jgi:hypothetical protein
MPLVPPVEFSQIKMHLEQGGLQGTDQGKGYKKTNNPNCAQVSE